MTLNEHTVELGEYSEHYQLPGLNVAQGAFLTGSYLGRPLHNS